MAAAPTEIIRGGRIFIICKAVNQGRIWKVRWLIHEVMPLVFAACHPEFEKISKVVPASALELLANDSMGEHTPILEEPPAPPFTCESGLE